MLRSLRDTQAAFAAHLVGHDRADLVTAIGGDSRSALQRLQLHRHHVARSISAALAATFPTVEAVVGREFFGLLARDFMAGTALGDPVLSRYGEHFPQFVAAKQDMHGLPYLADVARLDWHNDLSKLLLDVTEAVDTAADEKGRATIIRRLRRALEEQ